MVSVEFTIEPFTEGTPGPHVTEPTEAIARIATSVEIGPFGTAAIIDNATAPDAIAALVRAALANGATHVSLSILALDDQAQS